MFVYYVSSVSSRAGHTTWYGGHEVKRTAPIENYSQVRDIAKTIQRYEGLNRCPTVLYWQLLREENGGINAN